MNMTYKRALMQSYGNKYQPNAVRFDGVSDRMNRGAGLTGVSDASTGIFYANLRWRGSTPVQGQSIIRFDNGKVLIQREATSNNLSFDFFSSGSGRLKFEIPGPGTTDFKSYLVAWNTNLSAGNKVRQAYIDGVSATQSGVVDSDAAFTIDYTSADVHIGYWPAMPLFSQFDVAELYLATGQTLDISQQSNRNKFITPAGEPLDLGPTGSLPTGTAPAIYFKNVGASYGTNSGTGGNFTVTGTIDNIPYP